MDKENDDKDYWQATPIPQPLLIAARTLRKNMTEAEYRLWQCLRGRRLKGFRFRKQHPMGRFVLDFYCQSQKLAIELDGGHHYELAVQEYDRERTQWLLQPGIRVIRFGNNDVLNNLDGVLDAIWNALLPPS